MENFTWDWIYEGYLPLVETPALADRLRRHIAGLRDWFQQTDYHIQTEPVCAAAERAHLTVPPVSRGVRTPRAEIRQRLDIPAGVPAVLVTMGGTAWAYDFLTRLAVQPEVCFVIPGVEEALPAAGNVRLLPRQSGFYHPDLVNAVDAVVGKVGYSTVAEVYQAGVPMGYIARAQFRESPVLVQYIDRRMAGLPIDEAAFRAGRWLDRLPALLALPRRREAAVGGAEQIARFVLSVLGVSQPEAGGQ
ncbi:MAG: hypothetical protein D6784_11500 [Chloroflexi bacterium]|nr:MAG: hypothetical protein D6784_11500 [Chloroflexota bacterium]